MKDKQRSRDRDGIYTRSRARQALHQSIAEV